MGLSYQHVFYASSARMYPTHPACFSLSSEMERDSRAPAMPSSVAVAAAIHEAFRVRVGVGRRPARVILPPFLHLALLVGRELRFPVGLREEPAGRVTERLALLDLLGERLEHAFHRDVEQPVGRVAE